jgi:hypothetical protein
VTDRDSTGSLDSFDYTYSRMPTSIHIPKPLLEAVDRRAKALQISRNRLIVQALEREVREGGGWSRGFFEQFTPLDAETAKLWDETMAAVIRNRRSKRKPPF